MQLNNHRSANILDIISIENWKKDYLNLHNYFPILIPMIFLPGSIFNYINTNASNNRTKIIDALLPLIRVTKNHQCHYIPTNKEIFHDLDTKEDLEVIKKSKIFM